MDTVSCTVRVFTARKSTRTRHLCGLIASSKRFDALTLQSPVARSKRARFAFQTLFALPAGV